MKKTTLFRILLLIAYCVPFAFLSVNGDATSGTMLFYGVMIAGFALLCWGTIKTSNVPILYIGNAVSFASSYGVAKLSGLEPMGHYFKKYKPTYLRTLNSQLSAIFNFAVKYYGLPYNPVQRSGPMGKKRSGLEQYWKPEEFKIFIEAVSDKPMSKVIFNLLYWSGMRSGELLALTLNDFDFEARTVSITKNFARVDGEDLFLEPKTPKSNRKITLPQFVCDMVKDYADKLYGYDPSDRLFEITKHYLKSEMERGCKKTGIPLIRVHDIRHSHASLLVSLGYQPQIISERLGHESPTTTMEIYSHLYPNSHNEVADRLEAFG